MTRRTSRCILILSNALFLGGALGAAGQAASGPLDLSGRWNLNTEASDDVRQKMREGMGRGDDAPMGPPGGRGGGPGSGGPPGGPPGPGEASGRDPGETMRALFEPADEITISQSSAEVRFEALYGDTRIIRPSGKKVKAENGTVERMAEWRSGTLSIETSGRGGQKIKETWAVIDGGQRLTVEFRIQGGFAPKISVRRVYDRAQDAAP